MKKKDCWPASGPARAASCPPRPPGDRAGAERQRDGQATAPRRLLKLDRAGRQQHWPAGSQPLPWLLPQGAQGGGSSGACGGVAPPPPPHQPRRRGSWGTHVVLHTGTS
jgi:hypothetical protein